MAKLAKEAPKTALVVCLMLITFLQEVHVMCIISGFNTQRLATPSRYQLHVHLKTEMSYATTLELNKNIFSLKLAEK